MRGSACGCAPHSVLINYTFAYLSVEIVEECKRSTECACDYSVSVNQFVGIHVNGLKSDAFKEISFIIVK